MDKDAQYSLLNGSVALLMAWHAFLDRPMTDEQVREMYRERPHVLLMDANSAMRWAAHRLAAAERRILTLDLTRVARSRAIPGTSELN